ncbi:amidase [Rhodococcus jostii]|uniref:Asp-tRNAAsn/Glu-tRNAGln amidotransferase A subunit n=1 Tax=Rhodococcus jostii TaxID=132919 RepID=A0A1H4S8A0_RHOJO|nr:amidase [Rhodococcus jostii]SEC40342.1 Asp-tRNAAsn/Glu-tRNAGln amidotransferase A subunit [Rhodococcus jostii]
MSLDWDIQEATIDRVHQAYRDRTATVRDVVQAYLDRIATLDAAGPHLNSVITVSTTALDEADALDRAFASTGELSGPLHGVTVLVKDQATTAGLRTTFGNENAAHYVPEQDATAISKLKAAGAIILGKTTMPDFATSWFSTSSISGVTKNPYDLTRDPGGSSSGTGTAIAANLALVGIGEDTGGSIRLPASFCNLVGFRATPGMISRTGMSPLVVPQDTAGPMTRTVTDAAKLLDVLVGYDPTDDYTTVARHRRHAPSFEDSIKDATTEGKRIGLLRSAFGDPADPDGAEVNTVIDAALTQLAIAGAELVDVEIPDLDHYVSFTSLYFTRSRNDMNAYFAEHPEIGIASVDEVRRTGTYDRHLDLFEGITDGPEDPRTDSQYLDRVLAREEFARIVTALFVERALDAVVFPDVRLPAPTHDDVLGGRWTCLTYPTNTVIASQLHFPAVSIPAGFTTNGLPVGLEIMSTRFEETTLLQLARGIEQVLDARRAPTLPIPASSEADAR